MYFREKLLIKLLKFLTNIINVTLKIFVPRDIDNHKNRKLLQILRVASPKNGLALERIVLSCDKFKTKL